MNVPGPRKPDITWNKTLGEAGWDKFSNSPAAIGTTIGAAGGGFAGYQSGLFDDFGDTTLRHLMGDDEPRDWQKWVMGTLGTILGGSGMRRVFTRKAIKGEAGYVEGKNKRVPNEKVARFVIPGYGQTPTYKSAKFSRRGRERMILEAKVLPIAAKLEKLSKADRELLWKMVTKDETLMGPLKTSKVAPTAADIEKLTPQMKEINAKVHELGEDLVKEGILSEKIWRKNKDKYLHRLYRNPDAANAAVASGGFGMIANEVRSRGRVATVSADVWARIKADMEDAGTAGGLGKTNIRGGGDWKDPDGKTILDRGRSWDKEKRKWVKTSDKEDPVSWEAWDDTAKGKGKGYDDWVAERKQYLKDNAVEIRDLYNREYEAARRIQRSSPLSAAEERKIMDKVRENYLPDHLKETNSPKATVTIRRDWTKAEREQMGEVTDILDTFLATGKLLAYDAATAKMLRHLKMTDSSPNKSGNHTRHIQNTKENRLKYGALADQWISEDMWMDMRHLNGDKGINSATRHKAFRIYRKFNAWWKGTKTVGNPAVHMGNFMSNLQHYDHAMAGYGFKEKWSLLGRAMRELSATSSKAGELGLREGTMLNEALNRGLLDATLVSGELAEEGIHAVKRIMAREATLFEKLQDPSLGLISASARITKSIWDKTGGIAIDKASSLYQYEDNVFRYALFLAETQRLQKMGLDKSYAMDAAVRKGRSWFVDYADVPPALAWARETGLPFLSYTYGIVPRLVETAMKHPMKVAKWAAIGHLANEAGWTLSDDSDREEIERKMEAQSIGYDSMWGIPGTSPTKIKTPDSLMGTDGSFWNIERIYAGGNLFDAKEGGVGQIDILPGFAQPSFGMAGAVGYTLMSVDQFTGRDIPAGKKIEAFYRQVVPNTVITPNSYANIKLKRAMSGKDGPTIDVHTPMTALASGFGIKVDPVDVNKLSYRSAMKFMGELGDIKKKIKNTAKQYQNGDFHSILTSYKTQEERDAAAERVMERKIEAYTREMERMVKRYNRNVEGR